MTLVLFILGILILIQIFIIGICYSNIILNIRECDISYNVSLKNELCIEKFKINLEFFLFKKIRILKIKIYKNYCEILKMKIHFNFLKELKDNKQKGTVFVLKNIWKLDPEIKNINLYLKLGTENMMLTIFLVPTITTVLSGVISNYMKKYNKDISKCTLEIKPNYLDINQFKLNLSTKISFDTITTLFFINKHRKIRI